MTGGNLVLVDGDIVVYRVGFASNESPWGICKSRVDQMLVDTLNNCDADVMQGYLTDGANNFRNQVAVTKPYKGNRPPAKPIHYDEIRKYLQEYHGFTMETKQEADDALGIAHAELGNWGTKDCGVIIASIDKDLLMIPGMHYNIRSGEIECVEIDQARKNYYRQVLTGDSTDNIMGLKGIGPVKAEKILGDTPSMYPMLTVQAYKDEPHGRLAETANLIWIRRDPIETDNQWRGFMYVENVYRRYK